MCVDIDRNNILPKIQYQSGSTSKMCRNPLSVCSFFGSCETLLAKIEAFHVIFDCESSLIDHGEKIF